MFELMKEWESSGLDRPSFCARHGLKLSTFSYWRTRYRKSQGQAKAEGFVAIPPTLSSSIELVYPNGVKLVLPESTTCSTIAALIHLV